MKYMSGWAEISKQALMCTMYHYPLLDKNTFLLHTCTPISLRAGSSILLVELWNNIWGQQRMCINFHMVGPFSSVQLYRSQPHPSHPHVPRDQSLQRFHAELYWCFVFPLCGLFLCKEKVGQLASLCSGGFYVFRSCAPGGSHPAWFHV